MKQLVLSALASLIYLATVAGDALAAPPPDQTPTAAATAAQKIDLNRATAAELVAVPGIGPRTAEEIVSLRTRKGAFTSLEDLLQVPGLKEKKLAKLSEYLVVLPTQPAPTPATR